MWLNHLDWDIIYILGKSKSFSFNDLALGHGLNQGEQILENGLLFCCRLSVVLHDARDDGQMFGCVLRHGTFGGYIQEIFPHIFTSRASQSVLQCPLISHA